MKSEYSVVKDRPTMRFRITRDSVCAGDDVDAPHEVIRETHSFIDPIALASNLAAGYLPSVAGQGHSWDCVVNDQPVARIDMNGVSPCTTEVQYRDANHVHFRYNSAAYRTWSRPKASIGSIQDDTSLRREQT